MVKCYTSPTFLEWFWPQGHSPFRVRTVWYYYHIQRKGSNSDLHKTSSARFKCVKNQKVCVICIICRFHNIEQCVNYMHAKFQVAGFQNKRDIRHRSLDFVCLLLLGHLLVQVTWWFLASDGSKIQGSAVDFRLINLNFTSNICYLLSHTLIKFSVCSW